jgi:hypothetical protein
MGFYPSRSCSSTPAHGLKRGTSRLQCMAASCVCALVVPETVSLWIRSR